MRAERHLGAAGDSRPTASLEATGDATLVAAFARGEERAFRRLVERHIGKVVAVARRMLGDAAAADDVAQETFLRLWRNGASLEVGAGGLAPWLYRVASNLALDRIRARRPESADGLDAQKVPGDQERGLIERDTSRVVEAALAGLPERQRLAVVLCHYEDNSLAEAAKILQTTVEAVESLLGRARRALRRTLKDEWRALLPETGTD